MCSCFSLTPAVHIVLLYTIFFFNDTATTEIYTLSLHDALPISGVHAVPVERALPAADQARRRRAPEALLHLHRRCGRSEEHTSELQSLAYLVCRLLLEKKQNCGVLSL